MTERWVARKGLGYAFSDSSNRDFAGVTLTTVERLGSPGVDGQVWKVQYEEDDAPEHAALKVFTKEIQEDTKEHERFLFEAEFPLQNEAQFVNVLNHGRLAGRRAILFELVDGLNLDLHLRDETDLDHTTRVLLARSVASSIKAMHERGMLHNDIKPQNIMVNSDGESVRIIDLGFSCEIDAATEYFGDAPSVGTVGFQAPEIVLAGAKYASPASDAWSVAASCFYVLVGIDLFKTLDLQSQSRIDERFMRMKDNQEEPLITADNLEAIGVQSMDIARAMELMLTPLMAKRHRLADPLSAFIEACTSYLEGDDEAGEEVEDGDADDASDVEVASVEPIVSTVTPAGASEIVSPVAENVGTDEETRTLRVILSPSSGARQVIIVQAGKDQYIRHAHLRAVRTHHRKIIQLRWNGNVMRGMPRTGLPEATLNGEVWDSLREIENQSTLTIDGLSVNIEYSEF